MVLLHFRVPGRSGSVLLAPFFSGPLSGGGPERIFWSFFWNFGEIGVPLGTIWAPFSLFFPGLRIDRILGRFWPGVGGSVGSPQA